MTPSPKKLKISSRRPLTSSQQFDIRPATDWTFLMSGQSPSTKLVQRPWPEYVPESSAAVGRKWEGFNLSSMDEGSLATRSRVARLRLTTK